MSKSIDEQIAELKKQIAVLERQKELGKTNINTDEDKITIEIRQRNKIIFYKKNNDKEIKIDFTCDGRERAILVLNILGDQFIVDLYYAITTKSLLKQEKSTMKITQVDCPKDYYNAYIDITHKKGYYEIEIMYKFIWP